MASIKDAVAQNAARIASGGATGTGVGPGNVITPAPTPPLDLPAGGGLPQRGMFPANLVLASDRSDSSRAFRGQGQRSATFPYQQTPSNVTKITNVTTASAASVALLLQTNGINNPNQKIANFIAGANMSIFADPTGGITFSGGGGDGIIHGVNGGVTNIWESDPAFMILRDEFYGGTNGASATGGVVGSLGWAWNSPNAAANVGGWASWAAPYFNGVDIAPDATVNKSGYLAPFWQNGSTASDPGFSPVWPLVDNPPWQCSWIFQFNRNTPIDTNNAAFSGSPVLPSTSFYLGFFGFGSTTLAATSGNGARPSCFVGLRYDRDPGISLVLSAAANASAGVTVYTGTITGGSSNAYLNQKFTVAGFSTSANNGTFTCTASSTTTLTLNNASGVAESKAATAATVAISDTTLKFECVSNDLQNTYLRNNTQGNVFNTGVTPAQNTWYRLDMLCTTVGQVQLSLTGGGSTTGFQTITVPKYTYVGATITYNATAGPIQVSFAAGLTRLVGIGEGGVLSVTGWSGGTAGSSWSRKIVGHDDVTPRIAYDATLGSTTGQGGATFTFNAGLFPAVIFGNDSESSGNVPPTTSPVINRSLIINFFSFVWNPAVGGGTGIPNPLLPRYW